MDDLLDKLGIANANPDGNSRPVSAAKKARPVRIAEPIPWRPFPVDVLPEPISGMIRAGAEALGCDQSYIALPLMAGLASAIGATRRVQLKPTWTEPAVIWATIVGESGTLKSPALSLALDPLKRLQAFSMAEAPELLKQYERDKSLFEADMAAWKRKGRSQGEPPPERPDEPTVHRYLVDDITIEALADRLQAAPRGLLCACDELAAWLSSFDQYKSGRGGDVARWLSIHRADSLLVDRKTGAVRTVFVPRAAVSITGGIQPETLRRSLGNEHLANGLAARLLVTMPPRTAKRWTDAAVAPELQRDVDRVFGRLLALNFRVDEETGSDTPIDIPLSADGRRAWVRFYNFHARQQADLTGELAAAWSKLEGYTARLALIVHLVRAATDDNTVDTTAVDAQSILAGVALAEWFGNEAKRVYQTFGESDDDRDRRQIVELIQRKGGAITARQLRQCMRRFRDSTEEAEKALTTLAKAGLGEWRTVEPTGLGGRPTAQFRLSTVSTVDGTPAKPEETAGFGDVDSVDTTEINRRLAEEEASE